MDDLISKQVAITIPITPKENREYQTYNLDDAYERGWEDLQEKIEQLPCAQPETYKEKLNEIASALSEKFAYMNTCPNERDIILGYLGIKRCGEIHCNTDCTNTKCESHPLSSARSERKKGKWIEVDVGDCCYRCSECGFIRDAYLLDIGNYCPQCGAKMDEEKENGLLRD